MATQTWACGELRSAHNEAEHVIYYVFSGWHLGHCNHLIMMTMNDQDENGANDNDEDDDEDAR